MKTFEARTKQNYDTASQSIGNNEHYQGVKFDSAFNALENYHVYGPGLPPCLGHDLLEGVVASDLKRFIDCLLNNRK